MLDWINESVSCCDITKDTKNHAQTLEVLSIMSDASTLLSSMGHCFFVLSVSTKVFFLGAGFLFVSHRLSFLLAKVLLLTNLWQAFFSDDGLWWCNAGFSTSLSAHFFNKCLFSLLEVPLACFASWYFFFSSSALISVGWYHVMCL